MILTITWDLRDETSVEQATMLLEKWIADQLGATWPRPLEVASVAMRAVGLSDDLSHLELAARRRCLNLSQRALGRLAYVTGGVVSDVENGRGSKAAVAAIRRALDAAEAAR